MSLKSILFKQIKKVTGLARKEIRENVWVKCEKCKEISYKKDIIQNFQTCPICGYHFKISAMEKINIIIDEGSFNELDANLFSLDPLKFKDTKRYTDRIKSAMKKTNLKDAFISGSATVQGKPIHIGAFEFDFLGGSMGSVVGEKIARLYERSLQKNTHAITISCSGGARMQESILSLMQLAKTSALLKKLEWAGLAHIAILTHPTTGGVTASFAILGDVNIGEPGALIGFAGPRVIEQTIRQKLPEDFQTSEFLLDHGMIDMVLHRKEWRETINKLLDFYGRK